MLAHFILAAGVVLALDQTSKALALRSLTDGKFPPIAAGSPVGFRLLMNGRARPLFLHRRGSLICFWVFAVLGTILASFRPGFDDPVAHIGLGSAVGGATGNLFDRIWRGVVVDFIDIHIWPVFNVADVGIVLGTVVALARALIIV